MRKLLERLVNAYGKALNPPVAVEPPDGEDVCRTCLGAGGWSTDFEGGWLVCPVCSGFGTVESPKVR